MDKEKRIQQIEQKIVRIKEELVKIGPRTNTEMKTHTMSAGKIRKILEIA